jgi:hypothetical protein
VLIGLVLMSSAGVALVAHAQTQGVRLHDRQSAAPKHQWNALRANA